MSREFSSFLSHAHEVLREYRYARKIRSSNSFQSIVDKVDVFLLFDMDINQPNLTICGVNNRDGIGCIWQLELSHDKVKTHMEDDIGMYDDNGISLFGSTFAHALMKDHVVSEDVILSQSPIFPLVLSYDIGGMKMEASIDIPLLQGNLKPKVVSLLRPVTGLSSSHSESIPFTSQEVNSSSSKILVAETKPDEEEYINQPVAAKRRKVGGTGLLAGGRRK